MFQSPSEPSSFLLRFLKSFLEPPPPVPRISKVLLVLLPSKGSQSFQFSSFSKILKGSPSLSLQGSKGLSLASLSLQGSKGSSCPPPPKVSVLQFFFFSQDFKGSSLKPKAWSLRPNQLRPGIHDSVIPKPVPSSKPQPPVRSKEIYTF
ncbi:hypothetical protein AVEN_176491-1 [Araneus ventricosus]|uniref:Uncharacterized protein n=1 Tax=Araneus ventricosus TaxID=182803 RepID=A0A4Y2KZ96_ARAVE|nr:hypothetical protein AVEN_176491-1 [Araneus ventricosus]